MSTDFPRCSRALVARLVLAASLLAKQASAAETSILKEPGEHPHYALELEPEAVILFNHRLEDGPGAGVRASIPLMHNGFVSSINDTPAIGFGIDKTPLATDSPYFLPVVLQWGFWMTTHLSVFGEAGAFLVLHDGAHGAHLEPAFMGGGRWHFSRSVALTLRLSLPSTPALGLGVSFFL